MVCVQPAPRAQVFQYFDTAAVIVAENGERHTLNLCESCYNLREDEKKEPKVNGEQWKTIVNEKRSRGKLATGLGAQGFEHKITELHAAKKIHAKNLLKEAVDFTCGCQA